MCCTSYCDTIFLQINDINTTVTVSVAETEAYSKFYPTNTGTVTTSNEITKPIVFTTKPVKNTGTTQSVEKTTYVVYSPESTTSPAIASWRTGSWTEVN